MFTKKLRRIAAAGVALCTAGMLVSCATAAGGGGASTAVAEDCTPQHAELDTLKEGVLQVSVFVSAPYSILESAGAELGGVDGEIIKEFAAMECLTLEATPTPGAGIIAGLQSSRADGGIGGIYFNEDRDATLTLSDTMYRDGMAVLSPEGLASLDDLRGKKAGVIQGYLWNEQLQAALGAEQVTVYQDSTSLLSDLSAGRVDAAILTSAEAALRAEQNAGLMAKEFVATPEVPESEQQGRVVFAMNPQAQALAAAFNDDLKMMLESGRIAEILEANGMSADLAGE